jgi:D-lactate dehydrogenase (cytochrome)/glycolate oxidase
MDRTTIAAVEEHTRMGLDTSAGALLILQDESLDAYAEACSTASYSARTDDPREGEQFLTARRQALPALERKGLTLLDDVAVPPRHLAAMIEQIQAAADRHGLVIGTFGHAGDGNLHPTIVFDRDGEQAARAAFDDIVAAALRLGGTISGEHGVGSLKNAHLAGMLGEAERALTARIKAAFDPAGILNPGRALGSAA